MRIIDSILIISGNFQISGWTLILPLGDLEETESCSLEPLVWFSRILANALTLWVNFRISQCNCTLYFFLKQTVYSFEAVEGSDPKSLATSMHISALILSHSHTCIHARAHRHITHIKKLVKIPLHKFLSPKI